MREIYIFGCCVDDTFVYPIHEFFFHDLLKYTKIFSLLSSFIFTKAFFDFFSLFCYFLRLSPFAEQFIIIFILKPVTILLLDSLCIHSFCAQRQLFPTFIKMTLILKIRDHVICFRGILHQCWKSYYERNEK